MMKDAAHRIFRLDNDVLAFRFTATLSERAAEKPRERLSSSERLAIWLDAAGLGSEAPVTDDALEKALALREIVYHLGVAMAEGRRPRTSDLSILNAFASGGTPTPSLTASGRRWQLRPGHEAEDALAVIAQDAITVLGTNETARVKVCEGPDCAGLFLDTSRGINRRWCSMNTCGNRVKKARMAAR